MAEIQTIGICTGGGDCPGLNAVIRAAVRCAILKHNWRVLGFEDGFDGLIWPQDKMRILGLREVSGILPRGGTILGTTNRGNPFSYKSTQDGVETTRDLSGDLLRNARELGLDALIVIGGDGTMKIALDLFRKGLKVVGVPKTIDNDLCATEQTFGFDTALHTASEAIDKIHTTAESHHRVMLVEVMGRDAGWIALEAGISGGAHVILVPEIPFSIEKIVEVVRDRDKQHKGFTIIVVAEGSNLPADLQPQLAEEKRRMPRAGAKANLIGDAIARLSGKDTRVAVLGHIQRGGSPSPFDRVLSTRFGVAAADLIAAGGFGHMVCLREGQIRDVPIEDAVDALKLVDPNGEMVTMAKSIGISFGN